MGENVTAFRRAVLLFWCLVVTSVILALVFADTQDQDGSKINTMKRRWMLRKLIKRRYNKRDSEEEEPECNVDGQSCGPLSANCCSGFHCVENTLGKKTCKKNHVNYGFF